MKSPHDIVHRASFIYRTWRRGALRRAMGGKLYPPEDRAIFAELRMERREHSRKQRRTLWRDSRFWLRHKQQLNELA